MERRNGKKKDVERAPRPEARALLRTYVEERTSPLPAAPPLHVSV
jgi:hypothetical protein